jgi:hypothetical protein
MTNYEEHVTFLLLGDSQASEFYVPKFWNTLFVPSSCKNTTFTTQQQFEIKNMQNMIG